MTPQLLDQTLEINASFPEKLASLFEPSRYKILHGGRGGSKSWGIARALIILSLRSTLRVLCAREFQKSIKESVHHLLEEQINALGLKAYFIITLTSIRSVTGSEFIFSGLKTNITAIKSMEGIDIVWVEEAEKVSKDSWDVLIPTIRKDGSEIWISFNPDSDTDPTWKRFVELPPVGAVVIEIGYRDNPFFPDVLRCEMEECRRIDPETYDWVWEGKCRTITDANIIKRARIDVFDTPAKVDRIFFGADFGFASDPNTLDRGFIIGKKLFIDYSIHKVRCEIDDMPAMYDQIPESRRWPIKADCARPETISYLRRQGFNIAPAEKWQGSVEDGIAHLNGFEEVIIHERCTNIDRKCLNIYQETRMYKYKIDPVTREVLPIIVDKHNHHWDGVRYMLDGYIQRRGAGSNLIKAVNS
jgi:phage terminase large subunit